MKYIKLFEAFNEDEIDMIDDISAYVSTETSGVQVRYMPLNGDSKKVLKQEEYDQSKSKSNYVQYYSFSFFGMSNFFDAERDMLGRAKSYGFKMFAVNMKERVENKCVVCFFKEENYKKLDIKELVNKFDKAGMDIIFEDDLRISEDEFDILYESDDTIAIRAKTYKAAVKYSSDTKWKTAFIKNKNWIEKYMSRGSYYGGTNWYNSKKVIKEVETWYTKLLGLPKRRSEKEVKEFIQDFPRYLLYIVIFKHAPADDPMKKVSMMYDLSREEYGADPNWGSSYIGGDKYGEWLDSAHNQVIVQDADDKRITFRDIFERFQYEFTKAFHDIDEDANLEKERMYDLLGFWADKGGSYTKNPLTFVRNNKGDLLVSRPDRLKKTDNGNSYMIHPLGRYDDPNFNYWELDEEKPDEKEAPKTTWKGYFQSITDNVEKLKNSLSKYESPMGGDVNQELNGNTDGFKI